MASYSVSDNLMGSILMAVILAADAPTLAALATRGVRFDVDHLRAAVFRARSGANTALIANALIHEEQSKSSGDMPKLKSVFEGFMATANRDYKNTRHSYDVLEQLVDDMSIWVRRPSGTGPAGRVQPQGAGAEHHTTGVQ